MSTIYWLLKLQHANIVCITTTQKYIYRERDNKIATYGLQQLSLQHQQFIVLIKRTSATSLQFLSATSSCKRWKGNSALLFIKVHGYRLYWPWICMRTNTHIHIHVVILQCACVFACEGCEAFSQLRWWVVAGSGQGILKVNSRQLKKLVRCIDLMVIA